MPVPFIHGRDLPVPLVQRMLWVTPLTGSAVAQCECWQVHYTSCENSGFGRPVEQPVQLLSRSILVKEERAHVYKLNTFLPFFYIYSCEWKNYFRLGFHRAFSAEYRWK